MRTFQNFPGSTLSASDSRVAVPHLGTQRLRGGARFTPRPAPPPIPEVGQSSRVTRDLDNVMFRRKVMRMW